MEKYNIKVIQYANGTCEVRKYSEVIGRNLREDDDPEYKFHTRFYIQQELYFDEPENFKPDLSEVDEDFEIIDSQELLFKQLRSERVSYNRTKQEIFKLARQCKWEYFITLTFDKRKLDRYDYVECMKKANKWFMNQRNRYASELQYLFVPEQHKDGAWHIHGLIAQVGNMSFLDSGLKDKNKPIYNLSGWKNGFSTAVEIDDFYKVSGYITKYITKELCNVTKGKKRYYRSQNIPEPDESTFLLSGSDSDNFIDILKDSLGLDIAYEKNVEGYINVNYIYLQNQNEKEIKK